MADKSTLLQLEQILAKRKAYVIKSATKERRSISADPTLNELYEFVITIAKDLQNQTIFK